MKIISFDVGIKNMAYCIFTPLKKYNVKQGLEIQEQPLPINETGNPFEIADWNVISLLEKEEPHIYCNCASVKTKVLKNSKVLKKPLIEKKMKQITKIQNFFMEGGTSEFVSEKETKETTIQNEILYPLPITKLCCRVGKFKKGGNIYCEKHAKTQTEWVFPESRFSQKGLKKTKIEEMIKLASELNIENIGKKRIDIMKKFDDFVKLRCLEPVVEPKSKNAGDADLVSIGKKMKEIFDKVLQNHKDITHVLIENQISPLANRMKTIQGMLSQYFIMVYDKISIEFISSANKLKIFSFIKPDKEKDTLDTSEKETVKTQSQRYKGHKKDGVYYSQQVLAKNHWIANNRWSLESKKKDDLADCFLQGIWYLIKIEKIKLEDNYLIKIIK